MGSSGQAFLGNLDPFGFFPTSGNTRDQAAACFAFSLTEVSKNPAPELTNPRTHLTRIILSGSNCLTNYANQSIRSHLHVHGPAATSVRLNHLVKCKDQTHA